ncbi:MAG: hypothetical protein L6R36_000673 [Xanthoria steineri]|nr:MAG: hypothetical protein L6R36_000673 [Xanthoria steineri]
MAARLLRTASSIQQGPVLAAASKIKGLSTTGGSREPNSTVDPNETTLPQTAIAAVKSIREEIAWIQGPLRDPNVQLKPEAQARKKARLSALKQDYRHWAAKVDWWKAIYDKEPREIKQASDVYQRVQILKAALETDAESKEPVWTAQEQTTLETHLGKWEADVRKGDRWYKKIAWGPTIIGTAILNIILP